MSEKLFLKSKNKKAPLSHHNNITERRLITKNLYTRKTSQHAVCLNGLYQRINQP